MKPPPETLRLIGERIRRLCHERDWSQQDLSRRSGIPYQTIQNYESGRSELKVSALARLAAAFGVTPADLYPDLSAAPVPGIARAPPDPRRGPCDCSEDACRIARAYDQLSPEGKREVERSVLDNLVRHRAQAG